jgi:hypothetical protein
MGSGWDIHPEGNLERQTIGNKAKSLKRHQRALLCFQVLELGCSQDYSVCSECTAPSFKVISPSKAAKGNGVGIKVTFVNPFIQNIYSCCTSHISLFMPYSYSSYSSDRALAVPG